MSEQRNNMNISKWLPRQNNDLNKIFNESRKIERELRILGKKFATNINPDLPDYYGFEGLLEQAKVNFELSSHTIFRLYRMGASSADKNIERSSYKVLLNKKALLIRKNLKKRHFQLIFIIHKLIKLMLSFGYIDGSFSLCALLNYVVILTLQNTKSSSGTLVISNTFPPLLSNPRILNISSILQMITRYRTESCCASLISCLLQTCKAEMNEDNVSETSSIEVYRALTSQLHAQEEELLEHQHQQQQQQQQQLQQPRSSLFKPTIPPQEVKIKPIEKPPVLTQDPVMNDPAIDFFDNMANEAITTKRESLIRNDSEESELLDELIRSEDIFIASIIAKCLKLCPSAFETEITKMEIMSLINKASRFLWTNVGGTLEHYVLWWSQFPLACRPVSCTKYLRDWLMLIQPEDAPEPILSTLKGLGEILTVHAVGCTWDKHFRLCLVAGSLKVDHVFDKNSEFYIPEHQLQGTTLGHLWCNLFESLVQITNSCDRAGTIANELPIVEQIPVLHRLDHSIHTMRLTSLTKAKELCSDWNMKMFFRVVHMDMAGLCLERLNDLRAPELVANDPLEVSIEVNVALRAKLVSEIKDNIVKVKNTCTDCIEVLAAVCETTSLATLSLYFPPMKMWQVNTLQERYNEYVTIYLDLMYLPVIQATKDIEILNLTLKIICESLLENIYSKQIKFSYCGALNLLKDFEGVADWIQTCKELPEYYRDKLSKHEVLRMCEGVGKILLREPDEVISMFPSPTKMKKMTSGDDDEGDDKAQLPPEMFVPNQQRWLKLRARKPKSLRNLCLCNGIAVVN